MKKLYACIITFFSAPLLANEVTLVDRMKSLDAQVFEAFNNCKNQQDLEKYASYFSKNVEFYHDNGGVTWDRKSMISNTKKFACGTFTRKLISESFRAYSVNGFGAITEGTHIFCQNKSKKCEGKAHFVMVWRNRGKKWVITRVLSYGHSKNN